MTVTRVDIVYDEIEEYQNDEEELGELYVEAETSIIYEVIFFDDFVIVRPAAPELYGNLRKLSIVQFSKEFEEFSGNHQEVRNFLRYGGESILIEK